MRAARALLAGVLLLPCVLPLFQVDWFDSHEGLSYPARAVEVTRCWGDGMWSARWFPDLAGGRGYPFLSFYAPMSFWTAGGLHAAGLPVTTSWKVVVCLATILGAVGAYRLARQATGREGAAATALLWSYAPYRLRDLWTRGDLAELLALAWLPWALAATIDVVRRPDARTVLRAGAWGAAAIVSHNIAGLHAGLAMAAASICALVSRRAEPRWKRRAGAAVVAGSLALVLSAFFWVPALVERSWVQLDRLRSGYFGAGQAFVSLRAMLAPTRPPRVFVDGQGESMSFELGVALVFALAGWLAFRDRRTRLHAMVAAVLLVGGMFLATRAAAPLYAAIPLLQYGGLPWRALGPASLGAALLAGLGIGALLIGRGAAWRAGALVVVTASAIGTVVDLLRPLREIHVTPSMLDPAAYRAADFTASAADEYVPIWATAREAIPFRDGLAATGPATFRNVERGVARWRFDVEAESNVMIVCEDFFYPGWVVTVSGEAVEALPRPGSGHLQFPCPAGRSHVAAALRPSFVRRLATWASLGGIVAWVVIGVRPWGRRRDRASGRNGGAAID